jgi:hypothetical protein
MDPTVRQILVGLGRLGARAVAAAVDTALEEGQELVAEVAERIQKGRSKAQSIGKRPPRRTHVDVRPSGEDEMVGEIVDDEEE